ncbi:TPA: ketoisovalerate oxidoreductase [candidate division CPR2 bacterium]|uniref:Pyruvate/ketoisovalerate oxidoreductase n=1 Tax=candidate division CPR2 bacterium GW2011_GWC1_41_48 TaxID=1618344 RepID=A0A0G0W7Z1_UNCC2|nr:MAG: Pyruvate/ketoisovalerate oxidoreductase [candidate division CPR2 bacterium GW2011_GWC2_39_35]KKR27257.1 MAG: Pyruvate/ketoisovalerate oxidoreductase [candidate division CPR2 bacterium GW2011_GWD2_39_7]KKS09099.1 MAG: Pyruvate/ketoisovalerate oxidoreductase [candidate division CPR2 bacterium GW2011_GWC1_41_48]OGB73176.1 MAG: hypothetical protein A2Y26_00900 [candidate division CPR2 bacterium GWD2_39_7]HBG81828.1 ketoisovalerate oxidoreductase [candidate division CPR2 bacterium]
MEKPLRLIVTGEGGQGVQVIGKTLTIAAFLARRKTTYIPNYGVEQRGGVSVGFNQISTHQIPFPKFAKADILVVLCKRAVKRTEQYVTPETIYIYERGQISKKDVEHINCKKIGMDAKEYAEKFLTLKVFNVIYLGAITSLVDGLTKEIVRKALEEELGAKVLNNPAMHQLNFKALDAGITMLRNELRETREEEVHA